MNTEQKEEQIDPIIAQVETELAERGIIKKKDIAKLLGTSSQNYNNWRKRGIPPGLLSQVAIAMKWPIDRVIKGTHQPGIMEEPTEYNAGKPDAKAIAYVLEHQLADEYLNLSLAEQVDMINELYIIMSEEPTMRERYKEIKKGTYLRLIKKE